MKRIFSILLLMSLTVLAGYPGVTLASDAPSIVDYDVIIEAFRNCAESGEYVKWGWEEFTVDGEHDPLVDFGYTYADLDGDDPPELILLNRGGRILSIYTMVDRDPAWIFTSTPDLYCSIIDLSGNVYLVGEESITRYEVDGAALRRVEGLEYELYYCGAHEKFGHNSPSPCLDPENCRRISESFHIDAEGHRTAISAEEASDMMFDIEWLEALDLEFIPLFGE